MAGSMENLEGRVAHRVDARAEAEHHDGLGVRFRLWFEAEACPGERLEKVEQREAQPRREGERRSVPAKLRLVVGGFERIRGAAVWRFVVAEHHAVPADHADAQPELALMPERFVLLLFLPVAVVFRVLLAVVFVVGFLLRALVRFCAAFHLAFGRQGHVRGSEHEKHRSERDAPPANEEFGLHVTDHSASLYST